MRRWLRQLPNLISSIRILLILPIAVSLAHHRFVTTLWLFALAAISDAVDGFLAKRFGWQTELGGLLDPVADKLMLATVLVVLALQNVVPGWLAIAVIARDVIIVTGAVSYRVLIGQVEARPTVISKMNTLFQVVFILATIGGLQFAWPPDWALVALGALVLDAVVVSGLDYVLVYSRLATGARRAAAPARRSKPA